MCGQISFEEKSSLTSKTIIYIFYKFRKLMVWVPLIQHLERLAHWPISDQLSLCSEIRHIFENDIFVCGLKDLTTLVATITSLPIT